MDIITLAAAKSYTDKKTANGSAADLSNYYTKQEIDDKEFVTQDQLPEEYVIDDSLTIDGAAADAKATGDRLTNIEYQIVTTDLAYEHKDLPIGEKTVTISGDGTWGDTAIIGDFDNLLPKDGFNQSFPYCGITMLKKGDGFILKGTPKSSFTIYFTDILGNSEIPISQDFIGKTVMYSLYTNQRQSNIAMGVSFLNSNKVEISKFSISFKTAKKEVTVPENTVYIRSYLYCNYNFGGSLDYEFRHYLTEKDRTQIVTLNEGVAEIQEYTNLRVCSAPYKNIVSCDAGLRKFIIDYAIDKVTYLTPEQFGAVGDGETDDSVAIANCLIFAAKTGKKVLMAQKYFITETIDIPYVGLDISINDIVYDGTDCAIKIHGQKNSIKIHSITSNGIGIAFYGDRSKMTIHNDIEINTLLANSHGIAFYLGSVIIYQNTIRFDLISAGGSGCYGICYIDGDGTSNIDENNFYGGQISNCEWAVHNVGGNSRLYGIQIEGNVQGGFCTSKIGGLLIFYPRISESQRDGNLPMYKFIGTKNVHIYNNLPLAINEIDLSETIDVYQNAAGMKYPEHEGHFGIINGHIMPRIPAVGENVEVPTAYCTKAYVWGKFLIMVPHMAYRKEVITSTLDTRLIGRTEETDEEICSLSQLPTKFVVNTINTEIYLHESYCAFGFNEFEVEQASGFTCKVYDKLNNLIFDGTEQGDGIYKFNVYKDATYCANHSSGLLRVDFIGHYWQVTKEAISATDDGQGNVTLTTGGISI